MRKIARSAIMLTALLVVGSTTTAYAVQSSDSSAARTLGVATTQKTTSKKVATTQSTNPELANTTIPENKVVMVTVQEGDYLSKIADMHGTTWVRIYNANETITNPDVINPGMELRIPANDEALAERPLPTPAAVVDVAPVAIATPAPASPQYRPAASYPVSANAAKAFIYAKESGNNPNATNPTGCYGLGQDCNNVLRTQCGADYACQDAFFDRYAASRYGSWENAYSFWIANNWW